MDGLRFGRQFRALRIRMERRQSDVAGSAGLSRSQIATIDRSRLDSVTVGALVRAAGALGADVDLRLRWRGEQLDRLIDETHAAVVEAMLGRLRRHGRLVDVEVSFSIWGERRSIDIVAFRPDHGALLVIEAKSIVADSQANHPRTRSQGAPGTRDHESARVEGAPRQPIAGGGGVGDLASTRLAPGGHVRCRVARSRGSCP